MKVLILCEYPPIPAGLSTQADLLARGLEGLGVDVRCVHLEANQEKEWYYRWYQPDLVLGVGYWGYSANTIIHPQQFGMQPVPWLVADGYIAAYLDVLNALPLILTTSSWVRDVYIRDGIRPDIFEVLPVGVDTDAFIPREMHDPKIAIVRENLGIAPDELMILTIGGDAASKGAREVMEALARLGSAVPKWKYVCKVWPQQRTVDQNLADHELAERLGIADRVIFATNVISRNYVPYLIGACDIYAGPSRLEGFGMPHVEAGACGKPVLAINAMAFRDTLVHGETALLAGVAVENYISEALLDGHAAEWEGKRVTFDPPRIADYRASVDDIADALLRLLREPDLRARLGRAGRARVVERYAYRTVARRFLDILDRRGIGPRVSMPAAPDMVQLAS
jgi:glycosyltransferase involved in cell wall biosynthesis